MRERHVETDTLAALLADRACDDWKHGATADGGELLVSNFTGVALERLRSGKHEDAVAIYRGLADLKPEDPEVLNNLGFCLLPTSPREAAEALKKSISAAGDEVSVHTYLNLALAEHRAGGHEAADSAIALAAESDGLGAHAFMWLPDCHDELEQIVLDRYLDLLVDHISRCAEPCWLT